MKTNHEPNSADRRGAPRHSLKELVRPVVINDQLVRVGGIADGAYIIPEGILQQCDVCYSYGISNNTDFDRAFHRLTGKGVHMYDFSVDAPPGLPDQLKFHQEGIGPVKTANCDNYLAHLKANHDEHRKVLLKIDVEGAEYDWLLLTDLAEVSRTAICIVFEFHWLDTKRDIFIRCLDKLKAQYQIVHLHGNNGSRMVSGVPRVSELTFVHKAAATFGGPVKIKYPIAGLDQPNDRRTFDLIIDYRAWYIRVPNWMVLREFRRFKRTVKWIIGRP